MSEITIFSGEMNILNEENEADVERTTWNGNENNENNEGNEINENNEADVERK